MKICIVSDNHDRSDPLVAAIAEAQAAGAQAVIHCGDLIGVNTLLASLWECELMSMAGNVGWSIPARSRASMLRAWTQFRLE